MWEECGRTARSTAQHGAGCTHVADARDDQALVRSAAEALRPHDRRGEVGLAPLRKVEDLQLARQQRLLAKRGCELANGRARVGLETREIDVRRADDIVDIARLDGAVIHERVELRGHHKVVAAACGVVDDVLEGDAVGGREAAEALLMVLMSPIALADL